MKARVKATGEIVTVAYLSEDKYGNKYYNVTTDTRTYRETELEMMSDKGDYFYTYDYWDKLLHQYAGMAMQSMLSNTSLVSILFDATKDHEEMLKEVVICSHEYAHALVEKLKEEKL